MTQAPPALADRPQFTAAYWRKVPRSMISVELKHVINKDGGFVEIALKNGMAFQRRKEDIQQLLHANQKVNLEVIGKGELVTGLHVPEVGWAFRMTAEDLAAYTRTVSARLHEQRVAARHGMVDHLAEVFVGVLDDFGAESRAEQDLIAEQAHRLAEAAVAAMETVATR